MPCRHATCHIWGQPSQQHRCPPFPHSVQSSAFLFPAFGTVRLRFFDRSLPPSCPQRCLTGHRCGSLFRCCGRGPVPGPCRSTRSDWGVCNPRFSRGFLPPGSDVETPGVLRHREAGVYREPPSRQYHGAVWIRHSPHFPSRGNHTPTFASQVGLLACCATTEGRPPARHRRSLFPAPLMAFQHTFGLRSRLFLPGLPVAPGVGGSDLAGPGFI